MITPEAEQHENKEWDKDGDVAVHRWRFSLSNQGLGADLAVGQ